MDSGVFDGFSQHARARMQQRGITRAALDYLLQYGSEAHDHRGAVTVYFDKTARKRLERDADSATRKEIVRLRRLYAVLGGHGEIVTVGHRFRRINRS
jgi:hypothetical protein